MRTRARFLAFHRDNLHVYHRLVALARQWQARRGGRQSVALLYEVLRWDEALSSHGDPYRLDNWYRPFYARLIMRREPDLAGVFDTRTSGADMFGHVVDASQQALWHEAAADGWVDEALRILDEVSA